MSVVFSYIIAELAYSYLYINHFVGKKTLWFHEASDPGNNIVFNPYIGYKISKTPSRFGAVTSEGKLESMGMMQGNNFGFPDERDFPINPKDTAITRIAILGDSFTASQFTNKSWVEIIEDSLNIESEDSILLMNFSLDGGGLGNWHSIVKNIILKNNFKLDGIVFAIMGDNLDRKFMWGNDHILSDDKYAFAVGRNLTWDPALNPVYEDTLNPIFLENYLVLPNHEVNKIVQGNWMPQRKIKAYLYDAFKQTIRKLIFQFKYPEIFQTAHAEQPGFFTPEQRQLIHDLSRDCQKLDIPVLTLSFLTNHQNSKGFAKILNSHFLDDKAFQSCMLNTKQKINIEGDAHWNNDGVSLFAKSMYADFRKALTEANIIE